MDSFQLKDNISKQINYSFDIRRLLAAIATNWYWFAFSILLALAIAWTYIRYTTPIFLVKTSLLLENDENVSASLLESAGIDKKSADKRIFNEILVLNSPDLIGQVVDSLNLCVHYFVEGRVKRNEIYEERPLNLIIIDSLGTLERPRTLTLKEVKEGQFEITELEKKYVASVNTPIKRPWGTYYISYNNLPGNLPGYLSEGIEVVIEPLRQTINQIQSRYAVNSADGRTTMLELKIEEALPERGKEFLAALIVFYHKNELANISRFAKKTKEFITHQQNLLAQDLRDVDERVASVKSSTGGISEGATAGFAEAKMMSDQQVSQILNVKQNLANIRNNAKSGSKVLSTAGVEDPVLSSLIQEYNQTNLAAENYAKNSGEDNPLTAKAKEEAAALRGRIADAADKLQSTFDYQLRTASNMSSDYASKIRTAPAVSKDLTNIMRGYQVKENSYLYLYQKNIDNEIQLYAATNKSKVIVAPFNAGKQRPIPMTIYGILGFLGLMLPLVYFSGKELLDNKVNNEKDLASITDIPVIGMVSKSKLEEDIVVGEHVRTGVAEQFRLLRANLDYMGEGKKTKVILITSTVSGEGKTFIALNLGMTMALADKKVCILEFDLRKPKISERLNLSREGGISSYLAGLAELDKVVKPSGLHNNLYVANCGPVPPNPGELILNTRVEKLINDLKDIFDLLIIDTAPVGMVSDALILSKFSGVNLFITRQAHTVKEQVRLLDRLYREKRMERVAIIFNGVETTNRYGYGYGHGYGYGYGYGYGEGYYDDEEATTKKGIKKILSSKKKA